MENMDQEDRALALAAMGDPDTFDILYRRYVTRVYRYAYARVRNASDADDLTSQTFLAAFIGIDRYRGTGTFAAWLFGITCHLLATHFRSMKEQTPLDEAEDLPCSSPGPDVEVHAQLQLQRVLAAICRLTPERAEALRLRIFGELSCAEVAGLMGRSTAATKMLIHRGMSDLRREFGVTDSANDLED